MAKRPPTEMDRLMRASYAELWRLLRLQPVQSRQWRDFWLVWILSMVIWVAIVSLTGTSFWPWGVLIVAPVALVIGGVARIYWRRTRAT